MIIVIYGFLALSVLVFFHEFGHFLLAKSFNVCVEEFSIGYPPRLIGLVKSRGKYRIFFGKKAPSPDKGATIYSLGLIPFGGLNKLKDEIERSKSKDGDSSQVWWKKVLIALGGAGGNIVLAIIVFSLCLSLGVPQVVLSDTTTSLGIQVIGVNPGSPADRAGLIPGDVILEIDNQKFDSISQVQNYLKDKINIPVLFKIKRRDKVLQFEISPIPAKKAFPGIIDEDYGVIGITLAKTSIVSYPFPQNVFLGIKNTFYLVGEIFSGIWIVLKNLISKGTLIGQMIGPVGLVSLSGKVSQQGFVYFLQIVGIFSVALACFQILPIPPLDGGRVVFAIIEGLRKGKQVPLNVEIAINNLGVILLIFLAIFVTYKDILRLF